MDERIRAALYADRFLDESCADPDDDIRVVCRQFNRSQDEIFNLRWLIANGERHFGTLWREATPADIYEARRADSASGDEHG